MAKFFASILLAFSLLSAPAQAQFNRCPAGFCPGNIFGGSSVPLWVARADGVPATIDIDLAAGLSYGGALTDLLSITNATGGFATNWDGSLAQKGANTLRVGTGTGLLVEDSRQNIALQSQALGTSPWVLSANAPTIANNQTTAPDGTTTGSLWSRTSTASSYIQQTFVKAASSLVYSGSYYVKKSNAQYAAVRLQGTYPARIDCIYDLNAGTVASAAANTWTGVSATITAASNGWYRVTCNGTSDAVTALTDVVSFNANAVQIDGVDSSATSAGYVWGAQLEQAAFATSYIPTTTVAVTRANDYVPATGALLSLLQSAQGTVLVQTGNVSGLTAGNPRVIGSVGGGNPAYIGYNSSTQDRSITFNGATAISGIYGTGTVTAGTVRSAAAWSPAGYSVSGNGGTAATTAGPVFAGGLTWVIGSQANSVTPATALALNGYITRITAWASRLPDATLQRISDPILAPVLVTDFANGLYTYNNYNIGTAGLASLFSVSNSAGYCSDGTVSHGANALPICSGTGLIPEDTRTNVVKNSQAYTSGTWSAAAGAKTDNQTTAPDGTLTAGLYVEDSATSSHSLSSTANTGISASTAYTQSGYLKRRDYDWVQIVSNDGFVQAYANVNTLTCTLGNFGAGATAAWVTQAANGWCRVALTWVTNASSTQILWRSYGLRSVGNVASAGPSYAGDGVSGYYMWGSQTELGTFPSSYIPTVAANVTRNFDNIQALGPVLNLLGTQGANSMMAAWTQSQYYASNASPTRQYLANWSDSGLTRWSVYSSQTGAANAPQLIVGDGAALNGVPAVSTAAGSAIRLAMRWSNTAADLAASFNGAAVSTAARQFGSTLGAPFNIGNSNSGGNGLNSPLGVMKFYPGGLSNTSLQSAQ